jgi:uncharacterized protein
MPLNLQTAESDNATQPGKRLKYGLLAVLAFGLSLLGWAVLIEPDRLVVNELTVLPPNWPIPLDGLRIAALADLHVGAPHMDLEKVRRLVATTNQTDPDLVVLLGDYVIQGVLGGQFVEPVATARELKKLQAKYGVYAVLGNHDWWYSAAQVRAALENAGLKVLENEAVALEVQGTRLWLAGLSDHWTGTPLTHNPDLFPRIPPRISLTLAGHTHGGQCAFPIVGRPIVPSTFGQRYAYGHIIETARHLVVTSGIGTSILPVRFRVPPEILIIKLASR